MQGQPNIAFLQMPEFKDKFLAVAVDEVSEFFANLRGLPEDISFLKGNQDSYRGPSLRSRQRISIW